MENRMLGLVLVVISIVLFVLTSSFTIELNESMSSSCISSSAPGETCPHASNLPWQSYLGFSVSFLVLIIGLYLILQGGREKLAGLKMKQEASRLVKSQL